MPGYSVHMENIKVIKDFVDKVKYISFWFRNKLFYFILACMLILRLLSLWMCDDGRALFRYLFIIQLAPSLN